MAPTANKKTVNSISPSDALSINNQISAMIHANLRLCELFTHKKSSPVRMAQATILS